MRAGRRYSRRELFLSDSTDSRHPRPVKRSTDTASPDSRGLPAGPKPVAGKASVPIDAGTLLKRIPKLSSATLRGARGTPRAWDRSTRLAVALALGLLVAWTGQFGTPLFDRNPSWGTMIALTNAVLALALAIFGRSRRVPREAFWGLAVLILALTAFEITSKLSYARKLGGFEAYALPRHRVSYGPEARVISLMASDRTPLKATYLGRAKGDRPAGKAILIVPGWLSTRESFSMATLAQWFHPEFDVLVLDPRGQGESGGSQHPSGSARFDVLAGLTFLKAQGNASVGLLAEREGAYAAVLAAAEGSPQGRLFDGLFLASPVAQWGEPSLGTAFWQDPLNPLGRITWRLAAGVRLDGGLAQPLAEILPRLAGIPVMLTGPQEDPQGIVRQLHLLTPEPRSLRLFAGSGQPVSWKSYHRFYESARQFFGMTLAREPQASGAGDDLPPELLQAIEEAKQR